MICWQLHPFNYETEILDSHVKIKKYGNFIFKQWKLNEASYLPQKMHQRKLIITFPTAAAFCDSFMKQFSLIKV